MFDADQRLMAAKARLAYATAELARFWRTNSDEIVNGRQLAKLERDVELARDDVRYLETKFESRFGGI
jgi:hypothetical protein